MSEKLPVSIVCLCLAIFVFIAGLLGTPTLESFDMTLSHLVRGTDDPVNPAGPIWLEEVVRDISALGSRVVLLLILICFAALSYFKRIFRLFLYFTIALGLTVGTNYILKESFDRERPANVEHEAKTFTKSFPSAHAMESTFTYLSAALLLSSIFGLTLKARAAAVMIAATVALAISLSRIYLGVHHASDIVAGAALGLSLCLLFDMLARRLLRKSESNLYKRHRPESDSLETPV